MLELNVLVVNQSSGITQCDMRFTVERKRQATQLRGSSSRAREEAEWEVVHAAIVKAGPLAPGASALVTSDLSYGVLVPGTSYRFRAAAVDPATGAPLSCAVISKQGLPVLPGVGLGVLASQEPSGPQAGRILCGAGTMVGEHEAHRVGGEWVETGSGTMALDSFQGRIVLNYTYTFRGCSDTSLTAIATAVGQLTPLFGPPVPVQVTSATAQVTYPGARQQLGSIIQRHGGAATGVYAALVGERNCRGVLTLSNGTQTLDPATGRGEHRFDVRFSEAVGDLAMSPPSSAVKR